MYNIIGVVQIAYIGVIHNFKLYNLSCPVHHSRPMHKNGLKYQKLSISTHPKIHMEIKTYYISCIVLFCSLLFVEKCCFLIVAIVWLFQCSHTMLSFFKLHKARYPSVQEKINRACYLQCGVSILKPLCENLPTLPENLETFFQLEYPVFELIFCLETKEDPILNIIEKLQKKYPDVSTIISIGKEDWGINPKLCNIATGYRVTNFDLVWIADANIVASDAVLQDMVDKCLDGYRLVHQIPWGISGPLVQQTVGAISCGSILDRWYFATAHGRPYTVINNMFCTCLNGMSNLFSKPHLEKIGGLRQFANVLNEDSQIGITYDTEGYETIISKHPAMQNLGAFNINQYIERRVRWTRLRNNYSITSYLAPFELLIDNHLTSLLCVFMLVVYHGSVHPSMFWMHSILWLLLDALVFMKMDSALGLPNEWQSQTSNKYFFDWGRISDKPKGLYFFGVNVIQHYAMWISREFLGLYIRIKALESTDNVVWKKKKIKIDDKIKE